MPTNGSGTVQAQGIRDKDIQIAFWERAAKEGFTDERTRASAQNFRKPSSTRSISSSTQHPYLMGEA